MASLSIITLPGWGNVLSGVSSEYGSFFPGGGVASQGYFTRRRNPIRKSGENHTFSCRPAHPCLDTSLLRSPSRRAVISWKDLSQRFLM